MKKVIFTIAVLCGFAIEALAAKDPCQGAEGQDRGESNSSTVQSCDPNEMAGPLGKGEKRYVEQGEWMNYTIYFENKTNATAAAQEVFVDLPMDPNLDWSTLELGEIVFGEHIDTSLSGKSHGKSSYAMPGTNTFIKTTVTMKDGALSWYLRDWDPTTVDNFPASATGGFLPPNNPDTHCGEGHLSYRVRVKSDAPNGAVIRAFAQIVFDSNPMIETDPSWWNTVGVPGAGFGKSEINAEEGENVTFTVSGGAEDNASSVKLYLTYNTAAAADVDLKNGTVDSSTGGSPVPNAQAARSTNLKFPLTLTWAAGEIGEKTISIPVLADKAIEDAEQFTLQLADPVGMELGETRLCTVTITDPGYAELEAKIAAGAATKAEKTAWDKLQKAKAPYIRAVADPANAGKVTGSGLCASGKKLTLKAAANKGYVFTGWLKEQIALDGDRLVTNAVEYIATTPSLVIDRTAKPAKDTATSTTLTNVNENATFYATFITADEDKAAVGLALNGGEVPQVEDNAPSLVTNIICGVALNWPLVSSALSRTTVKVAGLPAGLKFTAKDIMKKGSKTEVEIPANTIYGAPTAASKIDKKTGRPVPSAVKVTVTTAGKSSVTYLMNITVDALPAWAVGNFEGFVRYDENDGGFATMSVTAAGKISGKISYGGTNWTFKADSYDITSETVGSTNFIVETVAVSGKATRKLWMAITDIGRDYLPDSAVAFVDGNFGDMLTEMHRLPWKDKGDAAAAALVASYAGAYSCTVPYGEDAGDVTFVLDEKGAVKGTVVLPDGTKKRKATFSSNALTGDNSLSVVIVLPPDAKKGYPAVFKVVNLVSHSGEGADNLAFRDPGVVAAVAELTAESGATGKVSVNPKYGQVAPGKDVTLTAKAAKGSVFHRWEITGVDTEGLDLSSATLKFKMADAGDVFATAVFVTAEEDAASIALSVDALGGEISPEAIISVTNTCGVALKWSVAADALSQPTVAVSGLPAGLKFTPKDIMKKGSKTEVEIPANTIYGAPTAESKLDAKTGLRKPSAVKFTVTTAGKSKRVYLVDMTVLPLPDWAVGTFNGGGNLGQVSLTIAKTGKLSGKYLSEGLTWTLASDSFDSIDESGDVYRATLIGKSGKLVMTNEIGVAGNAIGGYAEAIDYIAYQNNWKLEPWKSVGKSFAKSAALEYEDSASVAGVPVPGVLSLKFAASGAVTVKGSFITGINEKTGKEILYSASGTAVLAPQREPDANGAFDAVVFVYLPPKAGKFDGYVRCIGVRWTGEGWIKR